MPLPALAINVADPLPRPAPSSFFLPPVALPIVRVLMVNIGSTSTGGRVISVKADLAKIYLTSPACTEVGEKIALSRRIDKHWRLVGWGTVRAGTTIDAEK